MKHLLLTCAIMGLVGCAPSAESPAAASAAEADVAETANAEMVVQSLYDGFATGDGEKIGGAMSADIVWNEAESNPYADGNPYIGPDAIFAGVFGRIGNEWNNFTAVPEEFVVEGDRVVAFGRYTGTNKATGKYMDTPFVHSWTVEDGEIVAFQQYTDTAGQIAAMTE